MHPLLAAAAIFFFTVANISTCYLYLYPIAHACAFPTQPAQHNGDVEVPTQAAPFRLLVLGDPQLEGDSSLLNPAYGYLPSIRKFWPEVRAADTTEERLQVAQSHMRKTFEVDIPSILHSWRKRIDLLGNDFYLAHIYRTLHWATYPTHVAVLGDLIGSQWVSDEEFERRGWRYWGRVFQKGRRVEDDISNGISISPLGQDETWKRRIINVAGNHDIGYAGDVTPEKMQRFERVFGKANWETRFTQPLQPPFDVCGGDGSEAPELRIVVLNSLNLDSPVLDHALQGETYKFLNDAIAASRPVEDQTTATILLTHLPLHKEAGTCVDGPYITYHNEENGGGVKEQNHLSYDASKGILEGIYGMSGNEKVPAGGMGRNGIILTGHDHEGCDVYHHLPGANGANPRTWTAEKWNSSASSSHSSAPGIREITVRSMMGDFDGNAGLLSAWFDHSLGRWEFDYSTCALGKQHIWWAVHILDVFTLVLLNYVGWQLSRQSRNKGGATGDVKEKTL